MKKILVLTILFVLIGTSAFAWTCKSSGLITESKILSRTPTLICGVLVLADGNNSATITVQDDAVSASGTVLYKSVVADGEYFGGAIFPNIIKTYKGAYVTVSGTGAGAIIYYDAQ